MTTVRHETWYRSLGDSGRLAPSVEASLRTEVLVLGGGMTGLSAAHHLRKRGRQVTLVEGGEYGDNAPGLSAGMLSLDVEVDFADIDAAAGPSLYTLSRAGMDGIVDLVHERQLPCDLQRNAGSISLSGDHRSRAHFEAELALRTRLGITGTEILTGEAVQAVIRSPNHVVALYERDAHLLNPRRMVREFCRMLQRDHVGVYELSPVVALDLAAKTAAIGSRASIAFGQLVLCTGLSSLSLQYVPEIARRVLPVRSNMLATPVLPPDVLRQLFPSARRPMWWDNRRFYNYGRVSGDGRILFGGADLLQSTAQGQRQPTLADAARWREQLRAEFAHFHPELATLEPEFAWSGTIAASIDEFPLLGAFAPDCFLAVCATGLNLAFASGALVANLAAGETAASPLAACVDLHRQQRLLHRLLKAGVEFAPARWSINRWNRRRP
jgi:gamma-glutamylputrescine oxidase